MKKISSVESFTGGAFAAACVKKAGASKWFFGGLVTYRNEVKTKLGIYTGNGVVNENVAREMAIKGNEWFGTDICVSFTGNAGPVAMEEKPVGLCYIGINDDVTELYFNGTREEIINQAVDFAIKKIGKI